MKAKTVLGAKHKPSENWLKLQQLKKEDSGTKWAGPRKPRFKKKRKEDDTATPSSSNQPTTSTPVIGKAVGLDCEYVGVGKDGLEDMLARVSVVNDGGEVLLDEYVRPTERVTDFRTAFSGIRPSLITQESAKSFQEVQSRVADLIQGRLVVGHALYNDFKVLKLSHPKGMTRDTARYQPFRDLVGGTKSPSLKKVAQAVLGLDVQRGEHDSVADARVAVQLYQHYRRQWEASLRKKYRKPKKSK